MPALELCITNAHMYYVSTYEQDYLKDLYLMLVFILLQLTVGESEY